MHDHRAFITAPCRIVRALAVMALVGLLVACDERAKPPVAAPIAAASAAAPAAAVPATPSATSASVVAYLRGAEIQAENDAQRRELKRALSDLIDKPAADVRAARYAGPGGEAAQRDLAQLLRGHLVPATPQALDADALLAEKDDPEVRAALRDKLDQVERSLPRK